MDYTTPEVTMVGKAHTVVLGKESGFRDGGVHDTSPDPDQLLGLDE